MSSTMRISVPRTNSSKAVLCERNKSTTGTVKLAVKRKSVSGGKTKERGATTISIKHETDKARIEQPGLTKETDRKNVLSKKRSQIKTVAAEKEKTATSMLSKTDVESDETSSSVCVPESVSSENRHIVVGNKAVIKQKDSKVHSSINKTCKIEHSKRNTDQTIPKCSTLSKTIGAVSLQYDPGSTETSRKNLKNAPVKQDINVNADSLKETVASLSSANPGETNSKLSFPKAISVISDSCLFNQTGSLLSDDTEETSKSDTPGQKLSVFIKDSDIGQSKITKENTQNTPKTAIPCSTKRTKQIMSCDENQMKTENAEIKIVTSCVSKNIPNYQRTTSSSSNKDIKKGTNKSITGDSKLPLTTKDHRSISNKNQNSKSTAHLAKVNKSKSDTASQDWQSGLRSCDISTKGSQTHVSKSPDDKTAAFQNSRSIPKTSVMADRKSRSPSKSSSPSESDPRTIINTKSTTTSKNCDSKGIPKANIPPKSKGKIQSRSLIQETCIAQGDGNAAPRLTLNEQTTDVKKTVTAQKSECQSETKIPSKSVHRLLEKPSKLNLRHEKSKKPNGFSSRTSTPADSKVFSPSLKRIVSPSELKTDSKSRPATLGGETAVPYDINKHSQFESDLTTEDINRQNSQHDQKTTINARSRSVTPDASLVTSDVNTSRKLETQNSKQESNRNRVLSKKSLSDTSVPLSESSNSSSKIKLASKQRVTSFKDVSRKDRKCDKDSKLQLPSKRPISNFASTRPALKLTMHGEKPEKSQKADKISRDSNSRSRSTTPGDCSACDSDSSAKCLSKRTLSGLKQENYQMNQKINRESNSRSRPITPGDLSNSSSSSTVTKCTKQTEMNSKPENFKNDKESHRDPNSRSRSTTPSASSTCSSSDTSTKRVSKKTVSSLRHEIKQKVKTVNRASDSHVRSPPGTTSVSCERNASSAKISNTVIKRQISCNQQQAFVSKRPKETTTSNIVTTVPAGRSIRPSTKQTTMKQKRDEEIKENNRETKSRSRSSTPCSASSSTVVSGGGEKSLSVLTQTSQECTVTSETNFAPHTKTSKQLSVFSERNMDLQNAIPAQTKQPDQAKKVGLKPSKLTASGKHCVSKESKQSKSSTSTVSKQMPVLKAKNDPESSETSLGRSSKRCIQPELHSKSSDIPVPVQVKSYIQGSPTKAQTLPSPATELNSRQESLKSCNSLIITDGSQSTKTESKNPQLSESQNICSSKTQVLSTGTCDKPILKSTMLSIKPDSRINAGKISISERNKNKTSQSIQTSSKNRSCAQRGSTNIERKVNKTFVSDSKSRQTASLSVIKRDNVSTKSCNKSAKKETCKQKTQLPETLKFSTVHIEHGTECAGTNGGLYSVSLNSELIKEKCDLVSSSESDSFIAGKTSIKDLDNKDIVHCHTADGTGDSKIVDLDTINYHKTRTHVGNDTSSGLIKEGLCKNENICFEKNGQKSYKQCVLGQNVISSNTEFTGINFTDREVTVHDLTAKVNVNCLSDVGENEKQRVNEGISPNLTCVDTNHDCKICVCSHGKRSTDSENTMDLSQDDRNSDTSGNEMISAKTCNVCRKKRSDFSLQQLDNEDTCTTFCDTCKKTKVSYNFQKYYENTKNDNAENTCKYCNENVSTDISNSTSLENFNNLGESVLKFSQNFKCQNDKHTETQTFEIDTCDVNSSHKVPITEGCALEHTEFTDSQDDKTKCTDAVPVTGAASLQISNKRQDKKISSLFNCGIRNTALLRHRNGFIHLFEEHDDVDPKDSGRSTADTQDIGNMETRQHSTDVNSNSDDKRHYYETIESKTPPNDSKCFDGSSAIEQSLSDWQTAVLYDRLCSQNTADLQVLNNGEINKEPFEPGNICRKLNGDDVLSCDNMDTLQEVNHMEAGEDVFCRHNIKCDTVRDLNWENSKESFHENDTMKGNTELELKYDVSGGNIYGIDLKDGVDSIYDENDKMVCDNRDKNFTGAGENKTCSLIELHSLNHDSGNLDENSQIHLQNSLTCDSQNDENIIYREGEPSLPERNLRTIDAKLINTEIDLSFHASCKCEHISQNTSESGHTEIHLSEQMKSCKCKQYQQDNDTTIEIVSNCAKSDISGTLPRDSFLQNQLLRFKPDGFLSGSEHQSVTSDTPYVLEVQEKQTNCLDYANDSGSLFSQQAITEDGLIMTQCECANELSEFHERDSKPHCSQDKAHDLQNENHSCSISEMNINSTGMQKREECSVYQNRNNNLFFKVPKLSECIRKMYPHLKYKNAACSKISIGEEINHEKVQCSNMTLAANMNNYSFSMKQNDNACLLQHYKHLDRDDINVSLECKYCLSQTSEDFSNGNSKTLHSQFELNEVNSAEQGSLKTTENSLCTGSMPCDRTKLQISTLVNQKKSSEYHELNDLSGLFDDHEDTDSCGMMSRDHTRAVTEGTELSSELSADLTDCETLKNYNRTSYQDAFEDKPSSLSTCKITTQKSSCNLMFSEKSNEPKDFVLRYERKNSAGHKKFYSCKDEPDTGIAGTQEENNFRNLAGNRDEDITFEIKLSNSNIETPTHYDASSLKSENLDTKITVGNQGQGIKTVQEFSLEGVFESSGAKSEYLNFDPNQGDDLSVHLDNVEIGVKLSSDGTFLNGDNRFSSNNLEHGSDKDNQDYPNEENGILQQYSIKTDRSQTDEDLNCKLPFHKEEVNTTLNLPKTLISSASGVIITDNKNENQGNISDNLYKESNVPCYSEQHCDIGVKYLKEYSNGTNTDITPGDNDLIELLNRSIAPVEDDSTNKKDLNLPEVIVNSSTFGAKESDAQSRDSICSPSDDTFSDASEAFTDAEDRVNSPCSYQINTKIEDSTASGKDSNISCRDSTSTESFVDAVESLDDEYLTSVNFRHSKEFQNEETLSQTSSDSNGSTTSIVGSMEDLSGWEEFSENLTDLNDFSDEMEARRYIATSNEQNTFNIIPDGQTRAPVCRANHGFHDKNYQSPSPTVESNEIYPSMIKTNTLIHKDMNNDPEQKVIADSIFETGNGGSLKEINVKSVRAETRNGSSTQLQDNGNTTQNYKGVTVLQNDNTRQTFPPDTTKNVENQPPENTISQSTVGSKIETAVIKRTQRRRRRQIEQQKVSISSFSENCNNEEDKSISEINKSNLHHPDITCDNSSIEKNSSTHSEHFMYSCTVSDNMTFNNDPASGTQVLSEQVSTNSNLNESNLDRSTSIGTPLNYCYEDCVTKEVSMGIDNADTASCTFASSKKEIIFKDRDNQLDNNKIGVNENNNCELLTTKNSNYDIKGLCEVDTCVDISIENAQHDTIETGAENNSQLIIEEQKHVQKTDEDFDDIQFIDADDATNDVARSGNSCYKESCQMKDSETEFKQNKPISPNVSFTFSFGDECNGESRKLNYKAQDDNSKEDTGYINSEPEKVDDTESTRDQVQVYQTHATEKDTGEEYISTIKEAEVNCEIISQKTTYNVSVEDGQNQKEVCNTNEEIHLGPSNSGDTLLDKREDSEDSIMNDDICEESNISVRHALQIEKQKLACSDEIRSRKGLFVSNRNERRATIDNGSFEIKDNNGTENESKIDNVTTPRLAVKKSQSFRIERKQISPMASFMNPPEITDENDNKEAAELVNRKVSDMCKSFMTKTKASIRRTRAQSTSKSPAPQRKLMKWVNNQGKWMRVPVDEPSENSTDTNQAQNEQLKQSGDTNIHVTPETVTNKISKPSHESFQETIPSSPKGLMLLVDDLKTNTARTTSMTDNLDKDTSMNKKAETEQAESSYCSTDIMKGDVVNQTLKSNLTKATETYGDKNGRHTKNTNNETVESPSKTVAMPVTIHDEQQIKTTTEHTNNLPRFMEKECPKIESISSDTTSFESIDKKDIKEKEDTKNIRDTESLTNESENVIEMKVIGTTLNDAQCDQEKHIKRQELLFGLLDSYNRRKPRRFTQHESARVIQKSVSDNADKHTLKKVGIYSDTKIEASSDKQDNRSEKPKSIPKIKAVKIQEEVFECKKEYLKDSNISSSSYFDGSFSKTAYSENTLKQPIRKSKTFSGLGDIERQRRSTHDHFDISEERDTKCLPFLTGKYSNSIGSHDALMLPSRMVDKRAKAGLKLNLEKAHARASHDRSPSRLEADTCKTRSDKSPNRLCVDQPRMRVRSPEKGPRQIQRSKLLSEIVEVEENKDDNSVTCDRRQQQRQYRERQRQEVQKPVKRSNKRRSLSLPTGTLAFGDARIVYKNGHFTIETMDTSEYESSEPSDYSSSSVHIDSHEDDLWDTTDTSGVKSHSRETTDMHNKPLMRRQNAKAALKSSDSSEDVFYNETDYTENVGLYRTNLNGESQALSMGRTDEEVFNESCSSRTSDMSVDSYISERSDVSTDDSVTDSKKLSSSSLPESKDDEVKLVMQRAKRTSSFRAAQEAGSLRLSGIEEDKVHNSSRARSVSLDDSQKSDLTKSPKIQSVQNQNPTFLKKVMAKRKSVNENISGFTKQSESARDFFTKKMTLKGLFRKNKSDTSVNSPMKSEHPVSPPLAAFQNDDIGSVDTPPSSPYRTRNLRRRHTSADILKSYPDSSETDSNCPTPTQERSSVSRSSISSPSTPSHEGSVFTNLSSDSAPPFRDEDQMSITSASSFASSINSPPSEQPHKPKTPKPVGASPRRNPSFSSHLSRTGSQSSQRNVLNSVTSLESDHSESLQEDGLRDSRCECNYETRYRKYETSNRNVKGSADSLTMCQFCKQREFYKSDSAFSSSSFHKQQLLCREKLSEDGAKLRRDSSGRSNYDRLGIISQTDVASSNSNDSGIQRDASLHSSNESIKGTPDIRVQLRRNKSLSPHPDRPRSEISVKWADGDSGDYDIPETPVKLRHKTLRDRPRPKSDLEDNIHLFDELFEEVLEDFETDGSSFLSGRMKAFGSEVNLQPYCSLRSLYEMKRHDLDRQKNRRMSTPHPIKSRLQRVPHKLQKQPPLVRSSSMPESLEKIHKRRKMHHLLDFHLDSLSRHMDIDDLSDESDLSFDQASLQERSVSVQSSTSQLTAMDEDEDNLTYAEALWDHITMDPEELGFRAQDVIEVLDMADKDWWFGVIEDREGWFPATFVRIRVNQDQLDDDLDLDTTIQDNLTTSPKLRRISMFNKNQARTNVVNEIINAEREYVKHLKDVVEGYIQHARKRVEMFPEERILLIFGNIETIYSFARKFLSQLEECIDVCPHLSEIGLCFLDNDRGFEIYSDYCNNHPSACEELDDLCKDSKYKHFFEACRLLQELVEIPLEGFLLTPVQKICKYPLQLAELLKYTPPDHPDYMMVKDALAAMRKIATLINERKRKMESIEKIAVWQRSVVDWEGPDLLERSSELIFSGELNKINTAGWSQERFFFLFDHQLVYCKKELLKRHVFSYKGRIDLDHCEIIDVPDGKDSQYNVTVKYGWKFHETHKDKSYLVYAKSEAVKQHWLKAIKTERQRVLEDQENDFCVPDHWKQTVLSKVRSQSHIKDKHLGGRTSHGQLMLQKDLKDFTYSTLPRHRSSQKHDKKKGWFKFGGGKKSKR